MNKPEFCKGCPINHVTEGYVPLHRGSGNELWVGEASGEEEIASGHPFVGGAGAWLNSMCRAAHIQRSSLNIINTIGCRPPKNVYPSDPKWEKTVAQDLRDKLDAAERALAKHEKKFGRDEKYELLSTDVDRAREKAAGTVPTNTAGRSAVAYCYTHHLRPVLDSRNWSRIVALGDMPLRSLTGRAGISLWRGSPLPLRGGNTPKVIPTLHPEFLMRQAGLFSVAVGDLRKRPVVPVEQYNLFPTLGEVKAYQAKEFAFDLEWDWGGKITLCGLTDRYNHCMVVPWEEEFIPELRRLFESATTLIGHNIIGADTKYFEALGWKLQARMLDTMLMQHLIQPDMRHSLAFVASVFSNKVFWKGTGEEQEDDDGNYVPTGPQWRTWNAVEALPRELGGYGGCSSATEAYRLYNARDTDGSFQCAKPLEGLLKKFEMENTYWNVSVPAGYICRDIADQGLKVDTSRLAAIRTELLSEIEKEEIKLPEGLRPYEVEGSKLVPAPAGTYKEVTRVCKGGKAFGGNHEPWSVVFSRPGVHTCDVCHRDIPSGKMKEVKKIRVPSTKRIVPWNSTPQVLAYAKTLNCKLVTHAKTGSETANKTARKIWGREHGEFVLVDTLKRLVTQANSFAKEGLLTTDRVYFNLLVHGTSEGRLSSSGKRRGIDPNIQNQPKVIRKIFIPDFPGWAFMGADIVQGENMLTAWLAKDWDRWERLHQEGFDEHSYMASKFFNRPYELVCKGAAEEHLRHPGKVINHGRNYGLGIKKTQTYLEEQGFQFSLADITEMIEIWKKTNKRTAEWQQETVAVAQRQGYLENPFGRRRWFQSRDFATKSLAFLPASTLADMVLRMMIALYPDRFMNEIRALGIERFGQLPTPWQLRLQVHDELTCQGPEEIYLEAARVLHNVMTQPWRELEGFSFNIEMIHGTTSWGEAKKFTI